MSRDKLLEAVSVYRRKLHEMEVPKAAYDHHLNRNNYFSSLAHCNHMLDQVEQFVLTGRTEKAMRWLGFIQGVMWTCKVYTIAELKEHNKPDEELPNTVS